MSENCGGLPTFILPMYKTSNCWQLFIEGRTSLLLITGASLYGLLVISLVASLTAVNNSRIWKKNKVSLKIIHHQKYQMQYINSLYDNIYMK